MRCEVPVGLCVVFVSVGDPGCDFAGDGRLVGNAAVEALRGQDAEFGLGEVEP